MTGSKVGDRYPDLNDFEVILDDARMAAATDKEESFVKDVSSRYKDMGAMMFWSDKQDSWLRTIAGPEDF